MNVDIIIIGLNAEKTLKKCIEAILNQNYEKTAIHIFYVDGGSHDQSILIAKSFPEITVINLNTPYPTPGLGRNKGWKAGTSPLVQFLDSDTCIEPSFLAKAVKEILNKNVGAVKGLRKEINPDKSFYNWIGDLEWNDEPGEISCFGGDVLIRREVLEKTHGYNEDLIAGEDPELSVRVKEQWKIIQLNELMCTHDLNMTTCRQYFWRAYRTGYGFAAVFNIHFKKNGFWKREVKRIVIRGGGFILLFLGGFFTYGISLIPGFALLLYPRLFKTKSLSQAKHLPYDEGKAYAWHCSFVVIPQFFGILRYYVGLLTGFPLRHISNVKIT